MNSTDDLKLFISVLSSLVALAAILSGAYVNVKSSRRQTLVPVKREQIVSLQKDISEFIFNIISRAITTIS